MSRLLPLLCPLLCAVLSPAQPAAPALSPAQAQALVARVLATELRAAQYTSRPMRYLLRKTTPRLTSTKDIVETRDGAVARLVAINDTPLSPSDEQREQARLDALAANPSLQQHRRQSEDEDFAIVLKLLRMLPDAFFYQYAGSAPAPAGSDSPAVEKFTFRPNPAFNPPDLETQALTAMSGELLIDPLHERVVRLEGHLQQDTDYGWGILGKLDKGGWVVLEQADTGAGRWRIVHVQMRMNLRILFKSHAIDTDERMTRYTPVPAALDYRQAIQMLRATPSSPPQNPH